MLHPRARTVAVARLLRVIGPVRRRRRGPLPRQQQPDAIRLEYYRAIVARMVVPTIAALRSIQGEILRLLTEQRQADGKTDKFDAGGRSEHAKELIRRASRRAVEQLHPKALEAIAEQFGKRTTDFQRTQLDKQVRAAIGIPLASLERPVKDLIPMFGRSNVELIKTIPERCFDRVSRDVQEAFESGMHPSTLAERFEELYDVTESDARRIARDQIGKLNADINHERQESLGVTGYIWRTARDQRVRDNHSDLDGEYIKWDEPPMGGGTDETEEGHPGEGIQCFPGDTRIKLFNTSVLKAYRRRYRGQLTKLVTSTGKTISGTANHPVLTGRGWLPLHLVKLSDHVFEASSESIQLFVDNPQCGNTSIEELFRAYTRTFFTHRVDGHKGGFHGDGSDEQIDIVDIDRSLRFELNPACSKQFCEQLLARADSSGLALRNAYLSLFRFDRAARSSICGAGKLFTLLNRHVGMSLEHRLGPITWLDTVARELASNGCATDAEAFRESLHAPAFSMERYHHIARVLFGIWRRSIDPITGLNTPSAKQLGEIVAMSIIQPKGSGSLGNGEPLLHKPCRIVDKVSSEFDGHVYNLQTSCDWYVAQNLIVHNCRCYAEPDLQDITSGVDASDEE